MTPMDNVIPELYSKDLSRKAFVAMWEVQKLADTKGGHRERRERVASIELADGSTNVANAYTADGSFLFSFALENDGRRLDICG